jgi:adenylate kinase family enzyme
MILRIIPTKAHEIIILGPPSSGKKTICRFLTKTLNLIVINKTNLLENIPVSLKNDFATLKKEVLNHCFSKKKNSEGFFYCY